MKILVVGAGAVGAVFALHLRRGGADVSFLVKPAHAAATRRGLVVFAAARRGAPALETLRLPVLTSLAEVATADWDAVILCVSSNALRADDWVQGLASATGDATVVALQPGLDDARRIAVAFGAARTVAGAIGLMAWASPLPGESAPAGTAFWVPPLASLPFSGPEARTGAIVQAFRAGGLPAAVHRDAAAFAARGAAVLESATAALGCAGWRRTTLRRDAALRTVAAAAAREALAVVARMHGVPPPRAAVLIRPVVIDTVLAALARLAPMELDRFFEAHYTKLAAQTQLGLTDWVARAAELGLPATAIEELRARHAAAFPAASVASATTASTTGGAYGAS